MKVAASESASKTNLRRRCSQDPQKRHKGLNKLTNRLAPFRAGRPFGAGDAGDEEPLEGPDSPNERPGSIKTIALFEENAGMENGQRASHESPNELASSQVAAQKCVRRPC